MSGKVFRCCSRCGIEFEENREALSKRVERNSRGLNECRDCRGYVRTRQDCRPWTGDINLDSMQPIKDGKPYLPGVRTCGNLDCVNRKHIVEVQVRAVYTPDYHGLLARTLLAGLTPCKVELCGRPVSAEEMCRLHYLKNRSLWVSSTRDRVSVEEAAAAYLEHPGKPEKCGVEGCGRPHRSKNLCDMHYLRVYRKARYDYKRSRVNV